MKRRKGTRLMALLLGIGMAVGMTACGQDGAESSQAGGEAQVSKESSSEEQKKETEESKEGTESGEDTVTLTLGMWTSFWLPGDGIFSDTQPVLQYIKEQTGVEIEFVTFDDDKYSVMMAGGDIPDICLGSDDSLEGLISTGQIIELDELLEQYGGDIMAKQEVAMAASRLKYGNNEHYYTIPTRVSIPGDLPSEVADAAFRLRYDVWKAIGSPEYETADELIEVLKQMQDYQREQTGDDTIYGLSLFMEGDVWNFNVGLVAMGYTWGNALFPVTNYATGETIVGAMDPEGPFWEVAEFFNKAYRAGILDPESLTQDVNTFMGKTAEGKTMGTLDWWRAMDYDFVDEDAVMVCMPFGPFKTIQGIYGSAVPTGSGNMFISSGCQYPEKAMELIGYLWSDEALRYIYNGMKGETWDFDESGNPVFIGETAEAYAISKDKGTTMKEKSSIGEEGFYWVCGGHELQSLDGKAIEIEKSEDFRAMYSEGAGHEFAKDYGCDYMGQVYAKWEEEGLVTTDSHSIEVTTVLGMMKKMSDESALRGADIGSFWNGKLASVLLAETESEFEDVKASVVEGLKDLGMQDHVDEFMELKAQAQAEYDSMFAK